MPDAQTLCATQADCDDGAFCNGPEQCSPSDAAADASGCVAGTPPCAEACEESDDSCFACPDMDGDGHTDQACGGDDCDDSDASRFPGNTEVCDMNNHDEDCDIGTVGRSADADLDVDGFLSATCCNEEPGGQLRCGPDCDDTRADVRPGNTELCEPDGADEDCDGQVNEGCTCINGATRDCSEGGSLGACGEVVQTCVAGDWPPTCPTSTGSEICDGTIDEDCDGSVDEGFECCLGDVEDCSNPCLAPGEASRTCLANNTWGFCGAPETCNYCDDDGDGTLADDQALADTTASGDVAQDGMPYGDAGAYVAGKRSLVDFAASDVASAIALDAGQRIRLGYGTLVVTGDATAFCSEVPTAPAGWALFVLRAEDDVAAMDAPLDASAVESGAPPNQNGVAVTHALTRIGSTNQKEFVLLRRGAAESVLASTTFGHLCTGSSATVIHRLAITPDDPSTAIDELTICAHGVSPTAFQIGCCSEFGQAAGECPIQFSVGDRVIIGAGAVKVGNPLVSVRAAVDYEQTATCAP